MRIYIRPFKDMPRCKHCGKRMGYWVPGLAEDEHAHPECEGRAIAHQIMAGDYFKRKTIEVKGDDNANGSTKQDDC